MTSSEQIQQETREMLSLVGHSNINHEDIFITTHPTICLLINCQHIMLQCHS